MMVIKVAGGVVLVALVLAFLLRGRLAGPRRRDVRPTLPPSPYQPSRGFRILDGTEAPTTHPVRLPRLDPDTDLVFGENSPPAPETPPVHLRHSDQWALNRSMRHSPLPRLRRRIWWVVVIVVAVLALLVALLHAAHHPTTHSLGALATYSRVVAPSS